MKTLKSRLLRQIIYIVIFNSIINNVFAEAQHKIQITNYSTFPVNLHDITGKCIKTQFGSGFTLNTNQTGLVIFDDSNSGECYYSDKNVSFKMTSQAFAQNPLSQDTTHNYDIASIRFNHSSHNQDWFTTIWESLWYGSSIGDYMTIACADLFDLGPADNPNKYWYCTNGLKYYTEQTMVYMYINAYSPQNFKSNMQVFNLSNTALQIQESLNNCNINTPVQSNILSGMYTSQYTMDVNPTILSQLGQCKFIASKQASSTQEASSVNFGVTTTYPVNPNPQNTLSWVDSSTVVSGTSTNNFVQCMNDSPNGIKSSIVSSPNQCFIGCPVTTSHNSVNGVSTATSNNQVQYKYYRSYRGVQSNENLRPIASIDYSKLSYNRKKPSTTAIKCMDVANIDLKNTPLRLSIDEIIKRPVMPYLLSTNKKYYLFCQVGKSANNNLKLLIGETANNTIIKSKIFTTSNQSSTGILEMDTGSLWYESYDKKILSSIYMMDPMRMPLDPVEVKLYDNGIFDYTFGSYIRF